jgi:hypothetical protein
VIFAIIMALAKGERARAFKSVSAGMLGSLGTLFGLLVVFSVVQVWGDIDRARVAVNREASAIRMMVLLAASFPGESETQIRNLLRRHVDEAVLAEWPTMAKQSASLRVAPPTLAEVLRFVLSLAPKSEGQIVAQLLCLFHRRGSLGSPGACLDGSARTVPLQAPNKGRPNILSTCLNRVLAQFG